MPPPTTTPSSPANASRYRRLSSGCVPLSDNASATCTAPYRACSSAKCRANACRDASPDRGNSTRVLTNCRASSQNSGTLPRATTHEHHCPQSDTTTSDSAKFATFPLSSIPYGPNNGPLLRQSCFVMIVVRRKSPGGPPGLLMVKDCAKPRTIFTAKRPRSNTRPSSPESRPRNLSNPEIMLPFHTNRLLEGSSAEFGEKLLRGVDLKGEVFKEDVDFEMGAFAFKGETSAFKEGVVKEEFEMDVCLFFLISPSLFLIPPSTKLPARSCKHFPIS